VDLRNAKLAWSQYYEYNYRLYELIGMLPEGERKKSVLTKLKDKERFSGYYNSSGILDFTGHGKDIF